MSTETTFPDVGPVIEALMSADLQVSQLDLSRPGEVRFRWGDFVFVVTHTFACDCVEGAFLVGGGPALLMGKLLKAHCPPPRK